MRKAILSVMTCLVLWAGVHPLRPAFAAEAPAADIAPPSISIDAARTSEPISKYIYGQFIEHLGRCIYGGIWAEMLEDRKFYFPITPNYDPYRGSRDLPKDALLPAVGASPWEIVGTPDSIGMVKDGSFVGDHTPLIAAGSGIRQKDLGLVEGKNYVGYIWLKAAKGRAVVTVTLRGATGKATFSRVGGKYKKYAYQFTSTESTDKGVLEIAVSGGDCFVGTASLMPGDHVHGMRADTLALLKQLNAPMYRWPGGNFVSGYDWRDGIGDRDRRPPRKNPAWTGVEHNDFGLDEFVAFCRAVDAEPLITVNTGFGDAYSAAQEVEYANASVETVGGKWRAQNGHPKPYNVKWWCIGNEMYGRWQLGFMQLSHYTLKHNQVVEYMRTVDPTIQLIAVGALGHLDKGTPNEKRDWSRGTLEECAEHMDLISEHFYIWQGRDDVAAHIAQMTDNIREKAEGHRTLRRELPNLADKDIRIAMDEWNYWYRPYVYGELGCIYRLRDALGVAAGIHEYTRNTDIITMAHYAQTVNVIGCIKTTKTDACFDATGLPLMLYRNHFGEIPVAVEAAKPLDVAAALSADRKTLTLGIVNPTTQELKVPLVVKGISLTGTGMLRRIAGDDPMIYNEPGKEPRLRIEETPVASVSDGLAVTPYSVTLYTLPVQ